MTDFEPLARVTADPLTKALLESAREDHSAAGAAERALVGLGLLGSATVAVQSSALGAAKTGSALGGKMLTGKGLVAAAQFVALGFLGGAALVSSTSYVFAPRSGISVQRPWRAPQSVSARRTPLAPPVESFATPAPSSMVELPLAPHPREVLAAKSVQPLSRADLPSAAAFPGASSVSTQDLDAQLSKLRAVRALLSAPNSALALLNDFDRAYPATPLAEEATVLRIEALANAGRRSEANALGAAFLRKNPHSAYAERVRAKLEQR